MSGAKPSTDLITRILEKGQTISAPDRRNWGAATVFRTNMAGLYRVSPTVSHNPKETAAVERARWLADLSRALDDAHKLASELGIPRMASPEAIELCASLAAARAQVQGLRLGRMDDVSGQQGPKWAERSLWPSNPPSTDR